MRRGYLVACGVVLCLGAAGTAVSWSPGPSWADDSLLAAEGGSFAQNLVDALQNDSDALSSISPLLPNFFDANVDGAREDFAAGAAPTGQPVDYAISELPLTAAEMATAAQNNRSFAYVPYAAFPVDIGAVVLCSNATTIAPSDFCGPLQVTAEQLAQIFTSAVVRWNDPILTQNNPSLAGTIDSNLMARNEVQPTAVSLAIETYLEGDHAAQQTWQSYLTQNNISNFTPTDVWPQNTTALSGGDSTMANTLVPLNEQATPPAPISNPQNWDNKGTIGALPADWVGAPRNIPTVAVQNAAGAFVMPTVAAMNAALAHATMDPKTNLVTFNPSTTDQAAYPIPVMSYLIVPTSGLGATKAKALSGFIRFILGMKGQALVQSMGAAPVTTAMVTAGMSVADQVAAEAAPSTTTTTTTPAGGSTTTSTTAALASTSAQGGGSTAGGGGSGSGAGTPATDSGSSLAFTGGLPWPGLVGSVLLVTIGFTGRRVLRRRLVHGSPP